jgi:cytochrome oxidase assembly protein ShyY1
VKKFFTLPELLKSGVAVLLIALCLLASNWQWTKGSLQTQQNSIIRSNIGKPAVNSLPTQFDPVSNQWLRTSLTGHFIPSKQTLVRNRYFQGQFGFEVLQLFKFSEGKIWVNRGWIKAGANANTPPQVPAISPAATQITARVRSEDLSKQLQGSFFALPQKVSDIYSTQKKFGESTFNFYLDLLASDIPENKPLTPIDLPDLTNGPHYAYAIQWLAFAVLILIGRIMLFRETQRLPLV